MESWSKRSSHASDTSSAYSGSDVMQLSADDLEADFAGLPESDGEEGFSEVRLQITRIIVISLPFELRSLPRNLSSAFYKLL